MLQEVFQRPLALARAVSTVIIPANGSVAVVAALSESAFSTMNASARFPVLSPTADDQTRGGTPADPVPAAAALAARTTSSAVAAARARWWSAFWKTSSVSTPTLPELEVLWYGALYATAGFASVDPSSPPSGLYGPWVTTDHPSWNGDFTIDYNQEVSFAIRCLRRHCR